MIQSDATTFDLGQARLRLKDGLSFSLQQGRHGCWYLVEDDSRSQFFRIGPAEYTFLSLLDGKTSMSSAMATTCSLMGGSALTENDAINLCKWLVDSGLAHTQASTSAERISQQQQKKSNAMAMQRVNPISIRFPLFELDRPTQRVSRFLGWIVSWPAAVVWAVVCVYGLLSLSMSWDRIGRVSVFGRDNVPWMIATWLVLKFVHELAHVLFCKKYGGKIGKGGILLLLLIPMPYVDVTSSWRFPNKYRRILTAAAGMFAELFLAAIAAIVWCNVAPGAISFHAANIMVAASIHTIVFNANPLMRFDGYHILADWLEIPNLGNHGQGYVSGLARRFFFGTPQKKMQYAGPHGQIIRVYGVAAFVWKVLLCFTLSIAAANLFHGIGLLVAILASVLWIAVPTYRLLKYLAFGTEFETPNRRRFAVVVGGLLIATLSIGWLVPAPAVISEPIVIDYKPLTIVRAETSGFVEQMLVRHGQQVQAGDLLVVLRDDELQSRLVKTEGLLAKSRLRAISLQNRGEIGAWQSEQATIESLKKQLKEIRYNQRRLSIRAESSGKILTSRPESQLGTRVTAGTELLSIGSDESKEAIALVSPEDVMHFATKNDQVQLRIWGEFGLKSATIGGIRPRAEDELPHFAFAGMYGGPLDVVDRNQVEGDGRTDADGQLMLTRPRVQIRFDLDRETGTSLMAGQTGLAHFRGRSGSLGQYVYGSVVGWMRDRIQLTHGL